MARRHYVEVVKATCFRRGDGGPPITAPLRLALQMTGSGGHHPNHLEKVRDQYSLSEDVLQVGEVHWATLR